MSDPIEGPDDSQKKAESAEDIRGALFIIWNKKDNTFLLEQRDEKCKYFPGLWNFPGEHSHPGEVPEGSAIRGAKEEFGLLIPEGSFVPLMPRSHKQPHAEGSVKVFITTLPEGQVAVYKGESAGMDWKTLAEVKSLIEKKRFGFGQEAFLAELERYIGEHSP